MTERITLRLETPLQGLAEMRRAWAWAKDLLTAGYRVVVTFRKDTRSLAQNQIMWSCLTDLSKQVPWYGKKLKPEGWKDWITGHLNGQELHPNMDGTGFISINRGSSTSEMTTAEMIAVIDLCHAFGADRGVVWSKTSLGRQVVYQETGEILQ